MIDSLKQFKDFINSVSDDIFPVAEIPKEAHLLNDDELEQRVLQIISEYPDRNANHVGPRLNAICAECKSLKNKERIRVVLQRIETSGLAACNQVDKRWYLLDHAKGQ